MQIMSGWMTHGALIHIHNIERHIHGNGIKLKVYGEMLVINNTRVYARELKLNTIEVLELTPMASDQPYGHGKYIVDKGHYDNYASVHVYDQNNNGIDPPSYDGPGPGGSIWLDFEAMGE